MRNLKSSLVTAAILTAFGLPAAALSLSDSVQIGMIVDATVEAQSDASNDSATVELTPEEKAAAEALVIARTSDPESPFMGDIVKALDGEVVGMVEEVLVDAADGGTTLVISLAADMQSPVTQFTVDIDGAAVSDGEIILGMTKGILVGTLENNM